MNTKRASRTRLLLVLPIILPIVLLTACGGGGTTPSPSASTSTAGASAVTLNSVSLSPGTPPALAVGKTQQLTVTGSFSDGSTAAVSSGQTFTSSNPAVATVNATGLVTTVGVGTTTVTVTDSGKTASVTFTVSAAPATLTSITVSPVTTTALNVGSTRQLTATGGFSDGGTATLGSGTTWASSAPAVASVSSSGLVSGVSAGSAVITVANGGVTAQTTVTVAAVSVTLNSIAVSPANTAALAIGGTQQLTVTGTFSDMSTAPVSSGVTYASTTPSVASVSATGLVTGVAAGTATITATDGSLTSSALVTVAAAASGPAAVAQVFYAGNFASNVSFAPFGGSVSSATVDATTPCNTNSYASLKLAFAPSGSYAGGALVDTSGSRNLSAYDSVTFYAKASAALTTDKFGFGNNAAATTGYETELPSVPLTTSWQKIVLPIPRGAALTGINGLFHFADGTNHAGSIWVCDIAYTSSGSAILGAPVPTWNKQAQTIASAASYQIGFADLGVSWPNNAGGSITEQTNYGYFSFSPATTAATVSATGLISGTNTGTAAIIDGITASLGSLASNNLLNVTITPAPVVAAGTVTFSTGFTAGQLTVDNGAVGTFGDSDQIHATGCTGPGICGGGSGASALGGFYYFYLQSAAPANVYEYIGIYVMAPNVTTFSTVGDTYGVPITTQTALKFTLNVNPEWATQTAASNGDNVSVQLDMGKLYNVGTVTAPQYCHVQLRNVFAVTGGAGATPYSLPLNQFTVVQNCGDSTMTVTKALTQPVSQVTFLGASGTAAVSGGTNNLTSSANTTVITGASGVYPSTLSLNGPITFQ